MHVGVCRCQCNVLPGYQTQTGGLAKNWWSTFILCYICPEDNILTLYSNSAFNKKLQRVCLSLQEQKDTQKNQVPSFGFVLTIKFFRCLWSGYKWRPCTLNSAKSTLLLNQFKAILALDHLIYTVLGEIYNIAHTKSMFVHQKISSTAFFIH